MTQLDEDIKSLDPCPPQEFLQAWATGKLKDRSLQSVIHTHLEFCPSCRQKVREFKRAASPDDDPIAKRAQALGERQLAQQEAVKQGPTPGTMWRTVPESEKDLFGPLVLVIDRQEAKDGVALIVAEVSEDIAQAIHTDTVLEPKESGLRFRCMVRAENTFTTSPDRLTLFAGAFSLPLIDKVLAFCKDAERFDENIPLSKFVFLKDRQGTELMRRRGVTSGMLVTEDDDPRLNFLEESKQRCSYLHYDQEMSGFAVAPEEEAETTGGGLLDFGRAKRAKELRDAVVNYVGEKFGSPLIKKLWPIAAMILVALVTTKTTQVIVEAPLKSEIQVTVAKKLADEEKRRAEAETNAKEIAALQQERSNLATKSVNLEAENSRLSAEIKKMAESITQSFENRISTRSEMEALKAKVSKIEDENLDLKKSNTELLAIQDRINKRLAQAEEGRAKLSMSMEVVQLKFDSAKGKEVLEAVHSGDMAALQELLREKEYVDYRDNDTGITPLHVAASEGHMAVAKFLIEKGAYVNAVDREGQTPLMKAAMKGDRGMVELLLNNRADVRMSDMGGRTALYWALANKHNDIADLLRRF